MLIGMAVTVQWGYLAELSAELGQLMLNLCRESNPTLFAGLLDSTSTVKANNEHKRLNHNLNPKMVLVHQF